MALALGVPRCRACLSAAAGPSLRPQAARTRLRLLLLLLLLLLRWLPPSCQRRLTKLSRELAR